VPSCAYRYTSAPSSVSGASTAALAARSGTPGPPCSTTIDGRVTGVRPGSRVTTSREPVGSATCCSPGSTGRGGPIAVAGTSAVPANTASSSPALEANSQPPAARRRAGRARRATDPAPTASATRNASTPAPTNSTGRPVTAAVASSTPIPTTTARVTAPITSRAVTPVRRRRSAVVIPPRHHDPGARTSGLSPGRARGRPGAATGGVADRAASRVARRARRCCAGRGAGMRR
jgi:hypothetical protein